MNFPLGMQKDGSYVPNPAFMERAIELGTEAPSHGDHPVGAVVTRFIYETGSLLRNDYISDGDYEQIVAEGQNEVYRFQKSSAHGEVKAIERAEQKLGRKALAECVLYTTHEPCPMCAGLVANTSLRGVVYGTSVEDAIQMVHGDPTIRWRSNRQRMSDILMGRHEKGRQEPFVISGFMREQCRELLGKAKDLNSFVPPTISLRDWLLECDFPEKDVNELVTRLGNPDIAKGV